MDKIDFIVLSLYKRILIWREKGSHIDMRVEWLKSPKHDNPQLRYDVSVSDYYDHPDE